MLSQEKAKQANSVVVCTSVIPTIKKVGGSCCPGRKCGTLSKN
jgi:hypothetical protein